MIGRAVNCPSCGTAIAWRDKPYEFPCDRCGAWLRAGSGGERLLFPPLILIMLVAGLVYGNPAGSAGGLAAMAGGGIPLLTHLRYIGLFKPRLEVIDNHLASLDDARVGPPPIG